MSTPQSVHVTDPICSLYFPATHSEHVPPLGPVDPALQEQFVAWLLAPGALESVGHAAHVEAVVAPDAVEYVPFSQLVHAAAPVCSLYVPATHSEHEPPSDPDDPALHEQFVAWMLARGEVELSGHL